jgi:hypothetical protein
MRKSHRASVRVPIQDVRMFNTGAMAMDMYDPAWQRVSDGECVPGLNSKACIKYVSRSLKKRKKKFQSESALRFLREMQHLQQCSSYAYYEGTLVNTYQSPQC